MVFCLVTLGISEKGETPTVPILVEVLDCLLQLGCKQVLCSSSKESITGSAEFQVDVKFDLIDLGFGPLHSLLLLLEGPFIVLCSFAGINIERGIPTRASICPRISVVLMININ